VTFRIEPARERDVSLILRLIKGLADYEKLADEVRATEESLRATLFGPNPAAEVVLAYVASGLSRTSADEPVGFALFFHNYSTFLGKRGLYLEDLFVVPEWRGRGAGRALLTHLAKIAAERDCGRFEWAVLDWNEPAIGFYKSLGAQPMHEWTVFRVSGDGLSTLAEQS
jgi:GNAT superfamily N-acetyltransferase